MTDEEFMIIAKTIRTFYPDKHILQSNEEMELWFEMLKDIDYRAAVTSVKRWVSLEKLCPTIADIREMSASIQGEKYDEIGEAWELVLKAVRNYGQYRTEDALNSLPPLVRKCVKQVGFKDICLSEKIGVERAAFKNFYDTEVKKIKRENALSKDLKSEILSISQSTVKAIEG